MEEFKKIGLKTNTFSPYPQNPELNFSIQPNYCQYSCLGESVNPYFKCASSSAFWLLAPAGIGTVGALLLALSLNPMLEDQQPCPNDVKITVIYTALATLALALYVYCTLNSHKEKLSSSYWPLAIGLAILLVFYSAVYFLLYKIDPDSFSGKLGDDPTTQFLTFVYYSITTFATAQDGDIRAQTLSAKSLVGMEILFFIYIFALGLALFSRS
ncbi:ion channel [Desulfosporosinus sp. PR]|uniref:ion channel n=1 Tax=Candidatus Desulfosporosinus nitrosoreducens TaxID=3401928 RepID=UPI0027F1BFEF|nr:ion channel [Desulfosporosinus sp. PR]MDQ7094854.1 ion channel [Desulfosporosinus sp. PR]